MKCASADDRGPYGGFTVLEMALAALLLVVILLLGMALAGQASSSWHHVYHDTHATHDLRKGLAAVVEELRQASTGVVTVDDSGPDADVLTYQVPVGRSGTAVQWGAAGIEDWQIEFSVEGDRLLRTVLDGDGAPQGQPQVLATGVDRRHEGAKGVRVTINDTLLTIRVRTLAHARGHDWRKEVSTTVGLRN